MGSIGADGIRAQDPFADTEPLLRSSSSTPSCSVEKYSTQEMQNDGPQNSSAAATRFPGLDPLVENEFQQSRAYSRTLHRHSISSLPSSYNPASRWSTLSGISLAEVSNISVLSLPLSATEIWGSVHYVPSSTFDNYVIHDITAPSCTKIGNSPRLMLRNLANIGKSFRRRSFATAITSLSRTTEIKEMPQLKILLLGQFTRAAAIKIRCVSKWTNAAF